MAERYEKVVLTTPDGRYVWWEGLKTLEYIPKGKRRPTETYHTLGLKNCLDGAILTAARVEAKQRWEGIRWQATKKSVD